MAFEFATANRILFGAGKVSEVAPAARSMGQRVLLVTGRTARIAIDLPDALTFRVEAEPTIDLVREGCRHAREAGCDVVVAIGGGSVIDAGKAIAALATNSGEPLDYLEVIGEGRALEAQPLPFIAVPTTAGTGSEVTRNAVLGSPEHQVKASLRSAAMLPRLAVVDPELTLGLPPELTATTGLDALTQLIEPYVSCRANPMTDALCVDGIRRVAASLPRAYVHGEDLTARTDMSLASLYGGIALANAGLGAVHGFAAPIGGQFHAPHGAVCATLLPGVMDANLRALRDRAPASEALRRYSTIAELLTENETPEVGIVWVRRLCASLRVPPLRAWGVTEEDVPAIVEKAARASSMKANPIELSPDELTTILTQAI